MKLPSTDPRHAVADAVAAYRASGDLGALSEALRVAARHASADSLADAAEPFRDMPEVTGPLYEAIVARRPDDARALVILATAYWLTGRGPEVVGELATRAIAVDAANRGAWHLWALTAAYPRDRMLRWQQVATRFADDDLARAALADNAASVATVEDDPVALKLAIDTYRDLLRRANTASQREALLGALRTLGVDETTKR